MNLRTMKAAGVEWVEWLHSGLEGEPRRCIEDAGKVLPISEVKRSTHGGRCKCVLIAVRRPKNPATLLDQ
jgi:hypothetical protein